MEPTTQSDPGWTRMPSPGAKFSGLSRQSLYRACEAGSVRFRSVKIRPDSKRGVPYFSAADVKALIEGASSVTNPATA